MASNNRILKLSKSVIDGLAASQSKEDEYTDSETSGLKLIVTKTAKKSFLFRYTIHGRKRAMKIGNYPVISLVEARKKVLDAKRLLNDGVDPQAQRDNQTQTPVFKIFCEDYYLPHARKHKRSFGDDECKLNKHLYHYFGQYTLNNINTLKIEQYLSSLRDKCHLAPATTNRHLALLSVIFNLAISLNFLEKNPCAPIRKLKEHNERQRYLTSDETQRLLAVMDDTNPETCEPNRAAVAAIKLLLLTGTRREEALNAKWEHINFEQRTWLLPKTKNDRIRHVQLNEAAIILLKSIKKIDDCPYVFVNERTKNRLNTPVKAFKRLLAKANIKDFRIHDLRHSFASAAVNSGSSLYIVQHLLGHASIQTTQRYAHLKNETLLAASENVAKAIQNL
ncbi:MAG TPA: tyrosine-type recombinase/integrase [Agitococcus sp.]|nr:tyrosine-type recombinase/integrase [Agitococcus sp.]HNG46838.1 tyrosine-type recombinase/integrase [Agitococcus sp.]